MPVNSAVLFQTPRGAYINVVRTGQNTYRFFSGRSDAMFYPDILRNNNRRPANISTLTLTRAQFLQFLPILLSRTVWVPQNVLSRRQNLRAPEN